jgi:hypothetical protein
MLLTRVPRAFRAGVQFVVLWERVFQLRNRFNKAVGSKNVFNKSFIRVKADGA